MSERLLSDGELTEAIQKIPEVWAEDTVKGIKELINSQKQAWADHCIGGNDPADKFFNTGTGGISNMGRNHVRNDLRDEQRERNKL